MKNDEQNDFQSSDKINTTDKEVNTNRTTELEKPSFSERWKNSKYLFIRGSYVVMHSIWTIVMAVGLFIAWLVAMLAT
ncbi:MAG: hypothetical protein WBG46_07885 [Nonlabens sp.]